jgi:hypothetical protein
VLVMLTQAAAGLIETYIVGKIALDAQAILKREANTLKLGNGVVVDAATFDPLPLHELGRIAYYRPDTLRPLKAQVWSQPVTPEKILRALGHI